MTELLSIKSIKQDSALQPRAKMDTGKIDEYTEAMKRGDSFPAVIVFQIGEEYYLVDGYHRFMAAQGAKLANILCDIRNGTMRDAVLHSAGVNSTHGLNRTNDDKRRAVLILLRDKEWSQWNDTKISEVCRVSPDFVGKIRKSILPTSARCTSEKVKVERNGKVFKMDTSKIGKSKQSEPACNDAVQKPLTEPITASFGALAKEPLQPGPVTIPASVSSPFKTGTEVKNGIAGEMFPEQPVEARVHEPTPDEKRQLEKTKRNELAEQLLACYPGSVQVMVSDILRDRTSWKTGDVFYFGIEALSEKMQKGRV